MPSQCSSCRFWSVTAVLRIPLSLSGASLCSDCVSMERFVMKDFFSIKYTPLVGLNVKLMDVS